MCTHWTTRLAAIGATALAANILLGSPASAYSTGFFCSEQSSRRANYSWGEGTVRTKVYYNNHCRRKFNVTLYFITFTGKIVKKCWRTPAGKSSKVWNYQDLNNIDRGC